MATSGTNCKMITINLGLAGMGPRPKPKRKAPQQTANTRPPVFPLIDPLKHFHFGPRRRVGMIYVRAQAVEQQHRMRSAALEFDTDGAAHRR